MTDTRNQDGEQEYEPEASGDDAGDPAEAFDALRETVEGLAVDLRREMTTIRKGVEMALEEFDEQGPAADYRPALAEVIQHLGGLEERLQGIEQSPALRNGPDQFSRMIENAVERATAKSSQSLDSRSRSLSTAVADLDGYVARIRARRRQDWWLLGAGAAGLALGIMATLFGPRILPFSAAPRVASIVMADTPWQAGMDLMAYASQESWGRVVASDQLMQGNRDAIAACRAAAAKDGKEQKCTIIVPAPDPAP